GLYTPRAVLRSVILGAIFFAASLAAAAAAHAREDVLLWHALQGTQAAALERLAQQFNAAQRSYRVRVTYRGPLESGFAQALALRRKAAAPHIIQIHEALTADLLAEQLIVPLWQALRAAGQ